MPDEIETQYIQNLGYEPYSSAWNRMNGSEAAQYNEQIFNAIEAQKARVFNSAEAQINRDWQERMSNTAYQRSVKDMLAAGLNPASLGGDGTASPASTPAGYAASANAASSSAVTGGAGLLGLVSKVAMSAVSLAMWKKFSHSAAAASSAPAAASAIEKDYRQSLPSLEEISAQLEKQHREEARVRHLMNFQAKYTY